MKSGFSTLLFYIAITISAADYTSEGFSAETSKNGIVKQLRYKGTPLLSGIQLNGSYHPGEEKHDARFFQSWDYTGTAEIQRKGSTMISVTNSSLGNKKFQNAVSYECRETFSPETVTLEYKATLNRELSKQSGIFSTLLHLPADIPGKGMKITDKNGNEMLRIIPKTFDKTFRPSGRIFQFALGKGKTFTVAAGEDAVISIMDSRAWGGKNVCLSVSPAVPWSHKPRQFPAGTVFRWTITITASS